MIGDPTIRLGSPAFGSVQGAQMRRRGAWILAGRQRYPRRLVRALNDIGHVTVGRETAR